MAEVRFTKEQQFAIDTWIRVSLFLLPQVQERPQC